MSQRKLRIEVVDDLTPPGGDYEFKTIASVEIELPAGMEIPGVRMIEAARLAYQHMTGADFQQLVDTHDLGGGKE
jgi:hypothetical protein